MRAVLTILEGYYARFTPFSDGEAWNLFRVAATLEAVGWSLLIFGIIWRDHIMPGNGVMVTIGGRIHGMLFVLYIAAALAFGASMRWSIWRTIIAGLFSVPPYGSIVFGWWEGRRRKRQEARTLFRLAGYHQLLAIAPG